MPSNVTFEFAQAKQKYEAARTLEDKLVCLREMRRHAPSHKGAEHLRAEISKKIKTVKDQMQRQTDQRKKTSGGKSLAVKKEGIGQIVLVSFPNVGKSSLINLLTNAKLEVASYPFTTKKPEVGMVDFKGAKIQLVELPGIVKGSSAGKASGSELLSIARNADALVFLFSSESFLKEWEILKKEFETVFIKVNMHRPKIFIKKSKFKGITISGKQFLKMPEVEFKKLLKSEGFFHSSAVLEEETTLEKIEEILDTRLVYKKAIAIVVDKFGTGVDEMKLKRLKKDFSVFVFSNDLTDLNVLKSKIFGLLGKILVWTKKPGEDKAVEPIALRKGSTVADLAENLHKDFKSFKFAKIYGSGKFDGQRVSRSYELQDDDVIEIYS